jgi:predicted Zn-dependent protease
VFSYRDADANVGIVSAARMDPRVFGLPRDEDLFFTRVAKMVTKHIGVMYFSLPFSEDPTNVMYNEIHSLDALDRVGEDFY